MKKIFLFVLALVILACAMPALAYAPGDPILLDNGIPYGNYGYQGLIALYGGNMKAVEAHITSPFSNQQGGGVSHQRKDSTPIAAPKLTGPFYVDEDLLGNSINVEDYFRKHYLDRVDPGSYILSDRRNKYLIKVAQGSIGVTQLTFN